MPVMYKLYINVIDTASVRLWFHLPLSMCRPRSIWLVRNSRVYCCMKAWKCVDSNVKLLYSNTKFSAGNFRPSPRAAGTYNYLSDDVDNEEVSVVKDYSLFLKEKENDRKECIQNLLKLFNCSKPELNTIFRKYPGLLQVNYECFRLTEGLKNCLDLGLKTEILKDNPWLLTLNASDISYKLDLIQVLQLNINETVTLLKLPVKALQKLCWLAQRESGTVPEGSRIKYLIKVLKCCPSKVCKEVAVHTFMQTLPFEHIKSILDLLLKYGVHPEDILNDVWAFKYNTKSVEDRLQKAHAAGIKRIRPWIIRCQAEVFSNKLQRRIESLNTLGTNSTNIEYLSERLECSVDDVKALSRRYPLLLKVTVLKLKEVLDFLFSEGFTPQQIHQVPRILCHSLETSRERLNEIRSLNHNPSSLIVLCKSKRDYDNYLNRLKRWKAKSDISSS